jgi:hypothetical protein
VLHIDRDEATVTLGWPDKVHGPWAFTFDIANPRGRWECVGVYATAAVKRKHKHAWAADLQPFSEATPAIGAAFWRSVPIGQLTNEALEAWISALLSDPDRQRFNQAVLGAVEEVDDGVDLRVQMADLIRRQEAALRPQAVSPRGVAETYDLALAGEYIVDGRQLRPLEAVRHRFGLASKNAAAQQVSRARKAGLLPPTTPGKARGRQS